MKKVFGKNPYWRFISFLIFTVLAALCLLTTISHFLINVHSLRIFVFPYISFGASVFALSIYSSQWFKDTIADFTKNKTIGYPFMVTFAISASFIISVILWIIYRNELGSNSYYDKEGGNSIFTFFDAIVLILYFAQLGIFAEMLITRQTELEISKIKKMQPAQVLVENKSTKQFNSLPIEQVKINDRILIPKGKYIPVNGMLLEKTAFLNDEIISGNISASIYRKSAALFAGMINVGDAIMMKTTSNQSTSYISSLIKQITTTQKDTTRFFEPVTKYIKYIFIFEGITAISILLVYMGIGIYHGQQGSGSFDWSAFNSYFIFKGVFGSLALLTAICPCALGVTLPALMLVASSKAYQKGIIFSNLAWVTKLPGINAFAFDKTGTLTNDDVKISDFSFAGNQKKENIAILKSLELRSNHPIAKAVVKKISHAIKQVTLSDYKEIVGAGVKANFQGQKIIVASKQYFLHNYPQLNYQKYPQSILMMRDNKIVGGFNNSDTYDQNIYKIIKYLKAKNFKTLLLTGDHRIEKNHDLYKIFAKDEIYLNVKPEEKGRILSKYKKENQKQIFYIGDGLNDISAFESASISASLGGGNEVVQAIADMVFINNDLGSISFLLKLNDYSKIFMRICIAWLIGYNVTVAIVSALAFINPSLGALIMAGSDFLLLSLVLVFRLIKVQGNI